MKAVDRFLLALVIILVVDASFLLLSMIATALGLVK